MAVIDVNVFATAGASLLRKRYKMPATISTGCMALMVNEKEANSQRGPSSRRRMPACVDP